MYFREGHGAKVTDVDGRTYLDYTLAWGPLILGHSHPAVVEAVCHQVRRAQTFGAQCELECMVAEEMKRCVRWCERVAFATTGTEAVQLALRLARAFTGRKKIVRFAGHYHGWIDNILAKPAPDEQSDAASVVSGGQSSNALADVLCLPWNNLDRLDQALVRDDDVAAVLLEPILINGGGLFAEPGFLEHLRRICTQKGILLIFDEVITGFRVGLAGAVGLLGVQPDLAIYGKALASGFPLSAVAGRADILDLIANGTVFHAGTLNGSPVALAAALATLEELARDEGRGLRYVRQTGEKLQAMLRGVFSDAGIEAQIQGPGAVFWVFFSPTAIKDHAAVARYDGRAYAALAEALLTEGVLVMPSGRWYVSTAHTQEQSAQVATAVSRALTHLAT